MANLPSAPPLISLERVRQVRNWEAGKTFVATNPPGRRKDVTCLGDAARLQLAECADLLR